MNFYLINPDAEHRGILLIKVTADVDEKVATAHDAITRAGGQRFRAIILTSLTTFAGLSPMMLEQSLQARFLIPMAVSLGYGVLFATVITLILSLRLYDFRRPSQPVCKTQNRHGRQGPEIGTQLKAPLPHRATRNPYPGLDIK